MDFTHIPEPLLYKRKSLDKLAMLHPLNAAVIKQLFKMEGWNRNYSREGAIVSCMNNAYYICTLMRLEFDATFREYSYQRIAREGYIEDSNTRAECVTLSLVALLTEHSTSEWRTKLQDAANDLRKYAMGLEEISDYEIPSRPGKKYRNICDLSGVPQYLENSVQSSWILPDDLFFPRVIDDNAILDFMKYNSTYKWDCWLYHRDEEDMHEMLENIGKTQQEKAKLINLLWNNIYFSRKSYNGPIRSTWIYLQALAKEFCPDCIEITGLHKIPDSGLDINKRIHELEDENSNLRTKIKELEERGQNNSHEQEKETLDFLEKWQQLSTRELAIFFAQALGVSFDPKLINQNQLASLAAMWTKPQPDTIRVKIANLFKEESRVYNEELDGFPYKTKDEALNVYYFVMRIARHYSSITPQMHKILDEINDHYDLGIVEKVDENIKEKQKTKKEIFDAIDKARKSGDKNN